MVYRVFIDTNILLDQVFGRAESLEAKEILDCCEAGTVIGYVSSASFYTLAYFVQKNRRQESALQILSTFVSVLEIIPTMKENLSSALMSGFSDLEDAFQYSTAMNVPLDYFITNNLKDYKRNAQTLPIISSKDFMNLLKDEK